MAQVLRSHSDAMGDLALDAVPVPVEWLLRRDPHAIVSTLDESPADARRAWSAYPKLRAVAAGAIVSLPPEQLVRATPRILDGIERICTALLPPGESAAGAGP